MISRDARLTSDRVFLSLATKILAYLGNKVHMILFVSTPQSQDTAKKHWIAIVTLKIFFFWSEAITMVETKSIQFIF